MKFDMNEMMKQVQQMQAQMAEAQEALANERVEGSAGGVVTAVATGDLRLVELKIDASAIDPDDPEFLADTILAAVNNALENARSLQEQKMGGMLGGLGGLGLPGF